MKLNMCGGSLLGRLYSMAIPRFIIDGEKSMPKMRSLVIVKSAMAKSAT